MAIKKKQSKQTKKKLIFDDILGLASKHFIHLQHLSFEYLYQGSMIQSTANPAGYFHLISCFHETKKKKKITDINFLIYR